MAQQPLRILMTADTIGGVWTYALELLHALAPYRCQVLLATLGAELTPGQRRAAAQFDNLTICESSYKLEWMDDPWSDVDASSQWLMELARGFRPHIVHLNTYAHGDLPWKAPVLMVGHSCVLSWWQAVKGEAAPAEWVTYAQRVRAGLARADLVVAPTRTMLNQLQNFYGPLRVAQTIYNARCPTNFAPAQKEDFILAIGRIWDEAKNIAILDQIAADLPWPVYVAGEQRHPGGGQVNFSHIQPLGQLDQSAVRDWLSRAALYVLPARYEPFGLSALEAALSGCTLVLGDIPSLREVWGNAACYVPPNDPAKLTGTLCALIQDPAQRHALSKAARLRARRYTPEAVGRAYWQAYTRLNAQAAIPFGLRNRGRTFSPSVWPSGYHPISTPGS